MLRYAKLFYLNNAMRFTYIESPIFDYLISTRCRTGLTVRHIRVMIFKPPNRA
jgi:hypothetical protein